ncbi:LysR substrate-binding domain-containing protein [Pseudomonas sp. GD03860]|uniref:LysR substrate-binding domain-containing protein n=1 Tax=Pseudomonas TaxID=286 RepID=UPI00236326F1|nr:MULTISPECIES: LysR substrate-binding domain-containing protein [Pseudomonas]MDD2058454.1 LysR substrate-binding domain-containing protein [Pseudomonas putida]MDH0640444.1 LysR substrate-binding domain-containing protein [Pseudomonas sp. GD03860]
MNLRSVDLNLLTVFDAIMAEQNLSRAADRIGMSQPAISNALSRLRHVFKDDLFIRTGHGMRATLRAQELATPIRKILDMVMTTLTQGADFDYTSSTRAFNLVLSDYGEVVLLSPLMRWLDAIGANVQINVETYMQRDLKEKMRYGKIDLCLWAEPMPSDAFDSQLLLSEELYSMVRRDHPLVSNRLTLEQYVTLKHLVLEWRDTENPRPVERHLQRLGLSRELYLHVHSFFSMPWIVAGSDVVCTMPSRMAKTFSELHQLKCFKTPLEGLEVPIYLSWHRSVEEDPAHRWLRNGIALICERL